MSDSLRIDPQASAGRFSRFELIGWWDQRRLANAKALVIGAGALGNEIIKNLALLGVGRILVVDFDQIEHSNLSRSVLYRESDCGRRKADAAAERAKEIYPQLLIEPLHANVVYDLGLGPYRWADVILGGLDNREARVAINRAAAKVGKPWIDGAIERLDGVARVFDPAIGPCYECTMSEVDWKMLEARRSCALLTRAEMEHGKVPTTPTTSSVIAGIQVQEAVKMLHGLETLSGQGFVFDGTYHQSYVVNYTRLDDCPSHEPMEPVIELPWSVGQTTAGKLLARAAEDLGPGAILQFNHDLLATLTCPECERTVPHLASLGKVTERDAICPECGAPRAPGMYHTLAADSPLAERTLAELGVPAWDVVGARAGERHVYYEFAGDRRELLGSLLREESPA
jgi:molybdopterin/thiamine biosynthesis adenylyltransferase